MKLHLTCLFFLQVNVGLTVAAAQENRAPGDDIMRQIYAASSGHFRGEAHFRQDGDTRDWTTSDHEVVCTQQGDLAETCEGVTGGDTWRTSSRYSNGVVHVEGESGDQRWTIEYRIVDAWYSDPANFGYKREWESLSSGSAYQGIDEFVQMGNRGIAARRMKLEGPDRDYSYVLFEYFDRVR